MYNEMGLSLSPEKTKITHITDGYNFLGQNVRRYGRKLLIKPSEKNVQTFLEKVRKIIRGHRAEEQEKLINILNPVIRGWANYHRHIVAKAAFDKVDHIIWQMLWRWAVRRHRNKGKRWIHKRYFHTINGRDHLFAMKVVSPDKEPYYFQLFLASSVAIKRHAKVQAQANPYDPEWEQYYGKRTFQKMLDSVNGRKSLAQLWIAQGGTCPHCKSSMEFDDTLSVHHPHERARGGPDTQANRVLVHEVCHVQVHRRGIKVAKPAPVARGLVEA